MSNIRVVIFEDNDNLRDSLKFLLETTDGFDCTGAYPDCSMLFDKLSISKPDVILMDIDMPGISGIEAVSEVKKQFPHVLTIMQTVFDDEERIFAAICSGASGYLLKGGSSHLILNSIKEVVDGGSPMSPGIARKVMKIVSQGGNNPGPIETIRLTQREKDVLKELVEGKSYKMIADALQMAVPTVNTHIRNIYEKLQVNSIQQAVATAIRKGLV
jgi:DNA-binding NarL/FixJ family response regulator